MLQHNLQRILKKLDKTDAFFIQHDKKFEIYKDEKIKK